MSNYTIKKVYLSQAQLNKLKSADEKVVLQIDKNKTPNYDLPLTKTQIGQISKGMRITISKTQLKNIGKKYGGFKDILNQIKPIIYEKLKPYLNIPKILEIMKGSGVYQPWEINGSGFYSKVKKDYSKQYGGLFKVLDGFKKDQPELFGGFLPFLIPILTSLGLGAASGAAGWGAKKILDKVSGSGCKKKNWNLEITENGISNIDIMKNMKNVKGFAGVFASDKLPEKIKDFENGIINFSKKKEPGTHWVCYYNDPKYDYIEYFDPFGKYELGIHEFLLDKIKLKKKFIPDNIRKFLNLSNKKPKISINDSFIQAPTSVKCGLFCMKYIRERNKGKSPKDVLALFTEYPSKYNEKFVLNK